VLPNLPGTVPGPVEHFTIEIPAVAPRPFVNMHGDP